MELSPGLKAILLKELTNQRDEIERLMISPI